MLSRTIAGILYPLSGGGALVLGALALLSLVPFLGLVVGPATSVWVLAIIRDSAKGSRSMPTDVPSDLEELLEVWFKTVLVSLVTLLPVTAVAAWGIQTRGPAFAADASFRLWLAFAGTVTLLYFPASLATVAVWDRALPALDPSHVVRVIRTMGRDYFVAVGLGALAVLAGFLAANITNSSFRFLPVVGGLPGFLISTAAMFWAAHILGWAIHRHAAELGWD